MYFHTASKCALFGICDEGMNSQIIFAIDEAMVTSKGANSVISYLHHYHEQRTDNDKHLVLHADNCW